MIIIFSLEELVIYLLAQNIWTLLIVDAFLFRSITKVGLTVGCIIGTIFELIGIGLMVSDLLSGNLKWLALFLLAIASVWMISVVTYRIINWKGRILVMSKLAVTSSVIGAGYTALGLVFGNLFPCQLPLLVVFCSVVYLGIRNRSGQTRIGRNCCIVRIKGKSENTYNGLWDTGNLLFEPISHWPVCIIKKKYLKDVVEKTQVYKIRAIPYQTVNGDKKIMFGYPLDFMEIEKEGIIVGIRQIYLAATETENELSDYDILLPYHIFDRRGKGCL